MNADELPLMDGSNAKHVDGMRECTLFNINNDVAIVRWDTIIRGKQYHIEKQMYSRSYKAILESMRKSSRKEFEEIERLAGI